MNKKEHAIYQVGLKVLIRKGDDFLFLRTAKRNLFDFPGGRIDFDEHNTALTKILEREIGEETGENLKYKLGKLAFQFRRHAEQRLPVFLSVYEAEYLSGEINLSDEHTSYTWINPQKDPIRREDFFSNEEYAAFGAYFSQLFTKQ